MQHYNSLDSDFGASLYYLSDRLTGSPVPVTGREEDNGAGAVSGLSMVHNSTLSNSTFWVGGSLVRCQRNKNFGVGAGAGGVRGKITGFSKRSRIRLMHEIAKIDKSKLPAFVTLTFPDEFYKDRLNVRVVKKLYKRFEARLRRAFDRMGFVWRLEYKDRQSGLYVGALFPHFHLLVWGVVDLFAFRVWVAKTWWECCGELSSDHFAAGTSVEWVKSHRGVMWYVSKYMAKSSDYEFETGRIWGVVNEQNIPFVRGMLVVLTEEEAVRLLRYMRRYARVRGRDYHSLTLFMDAEFWWRNLDRILYP